MPPSGPSGVGGPCRQRPCPRHRSTRQFQGGGTRPIPLQWRELEPDGMLARRVRLRRPPPPVRISDTAPAWPGWGLARSILDSSESDSNRSYRVLLWETGSRGYRFSDRKRTLQWRSSQEPRAGRPIEAFAGAEPNDPCARSAPVQDWRPTSRSGSTARLAEERCRKRLQAPHSSGTR